MSESGYIHTFTAAEQDRLISQAKFLGPYHHAHVDLTGCKRVLEVGCGVGAQIQLLARRFPAHFTGVDQSAVQLARAKAVLNAEIAAGRAEVVEASAERLPFADGQFDAVVMFWVLEHMASPGPALTEIRRVLKPGGVFYLTEVYDSGLHVSPGGAAIREYFRAFMALQAEMGGDPDAGVKIPGYMAQAGFADISNWDVSPTMDARMSEMAARRAFITYFKELLLSGASQLLERGRVPQALVDAVAAEFDGLAAIPSAVFSYGAKQARGQKG